LKPRSSFEKGKRRNASFFGRSTDLTNKLMIRFNAGWRMNTTRRKGTQDIMEITPKKETKVAVEKRRNLQKTDCITALVVWILGAEKLLICSFNFYRVKSLHFKMLVLEFISWFYTNRSNSNYPEGKFAILHKEFCRYYI
jgi:hypothetical protein